MTEQGPGLARAAQAEALGCPHKKGFEISAKRIREKEVTVGESFSHAETGFHSGWTEDVDCRHNLISKLQEFQQFPVLRLANQDELCVRPSPGHGQKDGGGHHHVTKPIWHADQKQ